MAGFPIRYVAREIRDNSKVVAYFVSKAHLFEEIKTYKGIDWNNGLTLLKAYHRCELGVLKDMNQENICIFMEGYKLLLFGLCKHLPN